MRSFFIEAEFCVESGQWYELYPAWKGSFVNKVSEFFSHMNTNLKNTKPGQLPLFASTLGQ